MRNSLIISVFSVLIAMALLFIPNGLQASSIGNAIKDVFDNAHVSSEGELRYSSQARGYMTFGHTRIRWASPLGAIRPISLSAPSVNVGCNGIDITQGGMSYIKFDELVNKLKSMSGASSAFFFEAALSTLCKDCMTILNKLEDFANAINSINFDSCAAANAIGTHFGEKFGSWVNSGVASFEAGKKLSQIGSDLAGDGTEANKGALTELTDFIVKNGNLTDFINCDLLGCDEDGVKYAIVNQQGSLMELGLASNDGLKAYANNKEEFYFLAAVLRGLFGDLYGYTETGKDDEGKKRTMMLIAPLVKTPSNFVNTLLHGSDSSAGAKEKERFKVRMLEPKYDYKSKLIAEKPQPQEVEFKQSEGFVNHATNRINAIIDKINAGTELDQSDKEYLGRLPYPMVKTINARKADILTKEDISVIAEYVGALMARELALDMLDGAIEGTTSILPQWATNLKDDEKSKITSYVGQITSVSQAIKQDINVIVKAKEEELGKIVEKIKRLEEIQKQMQKLFYANGASWGGGNRF
jgi:conjugative transfer pilus assembly protein TraH